MNCPKCGTRLWYEDLKEEYYDTDVHDEKWTVLCLTEGCGFKGVLWQNYRLESEEWVETNEEDSD